MNKTTPQIFRDCLRLVSHAFGRSRKGDAVRGLLMAEFRRHQDVTDPEKITELQGRAKQALANYLTIESLSKLKDTQAAAGGVSRTAAQTMAARPRRPTPAVAPAAVIDATVLQESGAGEPAAAPQAEATKATTKAEAPKPATKETPQAARQAAEPEAATKAKAKKRGRPAKAQ